MILSLILLFFLLFYNKISTLSYLILFFIGNDLQLCMLEKECLNFENPLTKVVGPLIRLNLII